MERYFVQGARAAQICEKAQPRKRILFRSRIKSEIFAALYDKLEGIW
jgi:hypothetical protein